MIGLVAFVGLDAAAETAERASDSLARAILALRRRWRAGRNGGCGGSPGQDMEQEAPDELVGGERHGCVARWPVAR